MNVFPLNKGRYLRNFKGKARRIAPGMVDRAAQFVPLARERTNADSCVIAGGVPKAGTNLIYSMVNRLNKWHEIDVCIRNSQWLSGISGKDRVWYPCEPQFAVKKLRNGQSVHAHLGWSRELDDAIGQSTPKRRIKHLMIYRDPRKYALSRS